MQSATISATIISAFESHSRDLNDASSVLKYEKTLSNIQEVAARSGRVVGSAIEGDEHIRQLVEHVIYIPAAH